MTSFMCNINCIQEISHFCLSLMSRNDPNLDARPIFTSNMKCPFKSKPLLPISNNKVKVKVRCYFCLRVNAAVNPYLKSSIWGTLCYINCLYSRKRVMLKLRRRAMRHFVTLIEIHMHLIRVNPGHICCLYAVTCKYSIFNYSLSLFL